MMNQFIVAEGIAMEFHGIVPWNLPLDAYGRDWIVVEASEIGDALHQAQLFDKDLHPAQTEMEMFAAAIRSMPEQESLELAKWRKDELVGLSESAKILEWSKQQISVYIQRGKFPEPILRLASGPIWRRIQIEDFRDARK